MNTVQSLVLIFILLLSSLCQEGKQVNEFEESEITSEVQLFSFKTIHPSMIILIMKNENHNINSYDEKIITIFNKASKESKECVLYEISYCILDDSKNRGENEYILKFKNYKGGSFIIYNSLNAYPLKNFEKGFNLRYTLDSSKDINLNFYSEVLHENILLDLYPGKSMTIKKVLDTGAEETLEIKNNAIGLPKNFKYRIEFNLKDYRFEISIKKREIINYGINDELKFNLYQIPSFIIIDPSDYYNDIIYSYLYHYDYISYQIGIAEIDSEKIEAWNEIEFFNETKTNTYGVYEIYTTNITKTYLLLKITILNRFNNDNNEYFYTFKIFKEFKNRLEPVNSQEETLMIEYWNSKMIFISSNTTNLRTFEKKESNSLIYQKQSSYFPFIVLPTEEPYQLERFNLDNIYGEIFFNEKTFNNYLSLSFDSVTKQKLWYFDINETSTVYIKSLFGNPKIYYTDVINQEIINDIEEKKFEKVKRFNISKDIITFDSPFGLYIDPYENSHLSFILNDNQNIYIIKETSNKYLIENKEYILKAPSKLMVMIDDNFDSKVNIIKDGTIISTLTKENPSLKIDEANKDLIFKAEKNAVINLYYNIVDIFLEESSNIIIYPIDKKGEIMIVKILSHESKSYSYAINYGYDYFIPPDTKKIITTQTYFYIEDPYTKITTKKEDLRHYLILFGNNIKYEINYIKQYEKEKNSFYYKIKPKDNYAISTELNFPSGYYTYELLLCTNENVNMTMVDIYDTTQVLTNNELIITNSDKKALLTFESSSEFIFLQKENKGFTLFDPEIKFYIPKIDNGKLSILLFNDNFELNTEYSFLLFEDKNKDDELMKKIDNECFLFSLINNEIKNINYDIIIDSVYKGEFLYEEIDYTKFSDSKYLLIKIYSCKNEKDICVFSKTQRIYLENLAKEEDEELGITKIEEFTEYKVTTRDYMFSYDYQNYLNSLEDIFIYITSPTTEKYYVGELEVINPNLQNFNFKYRYTETIPLIKNQHIVSNGRYYFIFRNCSGVTFYLHNTIHFFPLNKINNYISETDQVVSNGNGLLYFTLTLGEDKYIYLEWNTGKLYLYSIPDKTTERKSVKLNNADKINKGSYILILDYGKNSNGYHFMINTNRYLVDLEKSKEIKVEMGTQNILQPTVAAVVNLSKYDNQLYLVSDSKYANIISCEPSMDIESIIENGRYGGLYLDTHIIKIDEINQEKCDPPYYNIKLYTSRFELVTEIYDITSSQNLTLKNSETTAFTVRGNGYKIVFSDRENIKWLDKMQTEFVDTIISSEQIQFKVNPINNSETNLRIKIIENEYNISIDTLTNNEISQRIKNNDDKKQISYYINLSKNKFLINHFDHLGKLDFYVSKDEMNENIIEEMLKTNEIDMNLFNQVTQNTFELAYNKILAIKEEKNIFSQLLMTPLIHDFAIEHTNTKYLNADRKYYIFSNVTIVLEENSDSIIKIYDINNTLIGRIDNNNPIFENKNYNKTLYLKSAKDAIIYIYHNIKENFRNIVNNKKDGVLILFSSDCEYNRLKYCFDNGFENYMPLNLELKYLEYNQLFINSLDINETIIQKGTYHTVYIECENKLLSNHSDLYENSTLIEGSYLIEKNRNIYMNSTFDSNKRNFFYQIFECNPDNYSENEFYASIDGLALEQLNNNTISIIKVYNQLELYLKAKEEFIFNYYKSSSNEDDYNNLEKNSNPNFNITYNSRSEIKIEILPKYKNIDFDFYFFMFLVGESKTANNQLSNKCYMKRLVLLNNDTLNTENIIVKKIEYKDGKIINNIVNTSELKTGEFMHSNILGIGKIFEDVEEYLFYEEQTHRIEDSDFPDEQDEEKSWVIFGIVMGVIVLVLLDVVLFYKLSKKKKNINLEDDNEKEPIILEE